MCYLVVCGGYFPLGQGEQHDPVVTEDIVHTLFDTVHMMIDPSYKSVIVETLHLNRSNKTNDTGYSKNDVDLLDFLKDSENITGGVSIKHKVKPTPKDIIRNKTGRNRQVLKKRRLIPLIEVKLTTIRLQTIIPLTTLPWTTSPTTDPGFPALHTATRRSSRPYTLCHHHPLPKLHPKQAPSGTKQHATSSCLKRHSDAQTTDESTLLDLMEEVNPAFAPLDKQLVSSHGDGHNTYRLGVGTKVPIGEKDIRMATRAMINLGKYGIFPLFRFGAAVSYEDLVSFNLNDSGPGQI